MIGSSSDRVVGGLGFWFRRSSGMWDLVGVGDVRELGRNIWRRGRDGRSVTRHPLRKKMALNQIVQSGCEIARNDGCCFARDNVKPNLSPPQRSSSSSRRKLLVYDRQPGQDTSFMGPQSEQDHDNHPGIAKVIRDHGYHPLPYALGHVSHAPAGMLLPLR